jgi:hypothetical protein
MVRSNYQFIAFRMAQRWWWHWRLCSSIRLTARDWRLSALVLSVTYTNPYDLLKFKQFHSCMILTYAYIIIYISIYRWCCHISQQTMQAVPRRHKTSGWTSLIPIPIDTDNIPSIIPNMRSTGVTWYIYIYLHNIIYSIHIILYIYTWYYRKNIFTD